MEVADSREWFPKGFLFIAFSFQAPQNYITQNKDRIDNRNWYVSLE